MEFGEDPRAGLSGLIVVGAVHHRVGEISAQLLANGQLSQSTDCSLHMGLVSYVLYTSYLYYGTSLSGWYTCTAMLHKLQMW